MICFENLMTEGGGERRSNRRVGKFQNKAHRTFDIINDVTPEPECGQIFPMFYAEFYKI